MSSWLAAASRLRRSVASAYLLACSPSALTASPVNCTTSARRFCSATDVMFAMTSGCRLSATSTTESTALWVSCHVLDTCDPMKHPSLMMFSWNRLLGPWTLLPAFAGKLELSCVSRVNKRVAGSCTLFNCSSGTACSALDLGRTRAELPPSLATLPMVPAREVKRNSSSSASSCFVSSAEIEFSPCCFSPRFRKCDSTHSLYERDY